MKFASFAWHVEDLFMYALNYNHVGAAKTWYTVPRGEADKLEKAYKNSFPQIFKKKPDVMYHLNLLLTPT